MSLRHESFDSFFGGSLALTRSWLHAPAMRTTAVWCAGMLVLAGCGGGPGGAPSPREVVPGTVRAAPAAGVARPDAGCTGDVRHTELWSGGNACPASLLS